MSDWVFEYTRYAEERGLRVIIARASGAALLQGMTTATTVLPDLGVPGVTHAIGQDRALDAALLAVSILSLSYAEVRICLLTYQEKLPVFYKKGEAVESLGLEERLSLSLSILSAAFFLRTTRVSSQSFRETPT